MSNSLPLVLALNAGSSSVKAAVLEGQNRILKCFAERLDTPGAVLHLIRRDTILKREETIRQPCMTHEQAIQQLLKFLREELLLGSLVAVGHRVVHGGAKFQDAIVVNDSTLDEIQSVSHLAPLHNPANIKGIRLMRQLLPDVPNVAVFDTSFHSTIPEKAYTYPLPLQYRQADIRKFGFHGTSVKYVSQRARTIVLDKKADKRNKSVNMIICHLGNGASVTAVSNGKSMETSMGFTPLAGLMMGTRCGSIDPSVIGYACEKLDKTVEQVTQDMNKESGLKSMVSDGDYDMRSLLSRETHDREAQLAVEMFVYRLAQHIASAMVALEGPLDAIVFTAGIGENSFEIRARTVHQLRPLLQMKLDEKRNTAPFEGSSGVISCDNTWPLAMVVKTDEEAMICMECLRLLERANGAEESMGFVQEVCVTKQ